MNGEMFLAIFGLLFSPITALLINRLGARLFFTPDEDARVKRSIWMFASILLSWLLPFIFCFLPNPSQKQHLAEMAKERRAEYAKYWKKFAAIEHELYLAKSDADPSVRKFINLGRGASKIGPMHGTQRELAFSNYFLIGTNVSPDCAFEDALPSKLQSRWYVGSGFSSAAEKKDRELYMARDKDGDAPSNEFYVKCKREGARIDVEIFSRYPVGAKYGNGDSCALAFVKHSIGEEAAYRYLGKLSVFDHQDFVLNKDKTNDLEQCFDSLLTKDELLDLKSVVTKKPCVVWIPSTAKDSVTGNFSKRSPYLPQLLTSH